MQIDIIGWVCEFASCNFVLTQYNLHLQTESIGWLCRFASLHICICKLELHMQIKITGWDCKFASLNIAFANPNCICKLHIINIVSPTLSLLAGRELKCTSKSLDGFAGLPHAILFLHNTICICKPKVLDGFANFPHGYCICKLELHMQLKTIGWVCKFASFNLGEYIVYNDTQLTLPRIAQAC